ncbi:hypothetical protein LB503_008407 [Fusarium chuoi]|nr:hypothetical protein LB503_008407 [Fusarium chuoi]
MGKKKVLVCYGVDIDAVAGWLGSYGGEDSTSDISRGLWAGTIGTRRLLKLFEKYNIKASWFIPGHSLETFPEECAMVRDAGHEIGPRKPRGHDFRAAKRCFAQDMEVTD